MRIDISLLPALAAAFLLVFARIGAMVMLLPGFGEANIPVRVRLGIALALTLILLPMHRNAYNISMTSMAPGGAPCWRTAGISCGWRRCTTSCK